MLKRHVFSIATLFICLAVPAFAQPAPETPTIRFTFIPLIVNEGFPLQVILTEKLHFKVDQRVHGKIFEPVYAFDREVIPPGAEVEGTVTGFRTGGKWKRISSILGGDFTPVREPQIRFDTLVLDDGTRIPIETSVEPGTDTLVRADGDVRAYTDARKQAGNELVKNMLWNLAPYHPQLLPAGIHYKVTLLKPLDFGTAVVGIGALDRIGSEPPAGSSIYARLETPLNSRTAKPGATVKALLTNPVFSWDHHLIFPVGSRLVGEVVTVTPARRLQHTGELTFRFKKIEPPVSILFGRSSQDIGGRLTGAQVTNELSHVRIDDEGTARIAQSKERFVAPALALLNLGRGFNANSQSFSQALTGAYSGNLISRLLVGNSGFSLGIPAGIAGRMIPPVGMGLSLFSAGRSVFANILARGQEIDFPINTPIEIRVDTGASKEKPELP